MLADLCPCFHQSPTKLCPDLVSFACWIVTKFWSFTRKSDLVIRALNCPILFCLRSKLCPNFGRLHVRLCPIFCTLPFSQPSWNTVVGRLSSGGRWRVYFCYTGFSNRSCIFQSLCGFITKTVVAILLVTV